MVGHRFQAGEGHGEISEILRTILQSGRIIEI